jgi:hypothetical protein
MNHERYLLTNRFPMFVHVLDRKRVIKREGVGTPVGCGCISTLLNLLACFMQYEVNREL